MTTTVGDISIVQPDVEPWIDSATLAKHLGFSRMHVQKLARAGRIPGTEMQNGLKRVWRFKISLVDAKLASESAK